MTQAGQALQLAPFFEIIHKKLDKMYQFWYSLDMDDKPLLTVKFFKTPANNEPVREWLKSLEDKADRKAIGEDVKTVQFGWPMGMPIVRKLEDKLWEVRTNLPQGIARTFFTVEGSLMILLHGIVKKSKKTPQDDLDLARKRLSLWRGE